MFGLKARPRRPTVWCRSSEDLVQLVRDHLALVEIRLDDDLEELGMVAEALRDVRERANIFRFVTSSWRQVSVLGPEYSGPSPEFAHGL